MPNKLPNARFIFNVGASRYRAPNGRFLSAQQVRRYVDAALLDSTKAVAALADQLRIRAVSLQEWERRMRQEVKTIHLYSAMAAKGGRSQLTAQDLGRLGAAVKRQYRYLRAFADDVQRGTAGNIVGRAKLYAQAGRGTFEATRQREMRTRGFDQERNVLAPAEHCEGAGSCIEQTDKGWVGVGSLVPIGGRLCVTNCRCRIEYRNGATGEHARG